MIPCRALHCTQNVSKNAGSGRRSGGAVIAVGGGNGDVVAPRPGALSPLFDAQMVKKAVSFFAGSLRRRHQPVRHHLVGAVGFGQNVRQ